MAAITSEDELAARRVHRLRLARSNVAWLVVAFVAAATLAAIDVRPAAASDSDVRSRFVAGFLIVLRADDDVRACYGCDDALSAVQRKALLWINAMSTSAPTTVRGRRARLSGASAFQHWAHAAYDLNVGGSSGAYSAEATAAIRYAWAAVQSVGLTRAWFNVAMYAHGCSRWWVALANPLVVQPCDL
jgi:hypothetical protein